MDKLESLARRGLPPVCHTARETSAPLAAAPVPAPASARAVSTRAPPQPSAAQPQSRTIRRSDWHTHRSTEQLAAHAMAITACEQLAGNSNYAASSKAVSRSGSKEPSRAVSRASNPSRTPSVTSLHSSHTLHSQARRDTEHAAHRRDAEPGYLTANIAATNLPTYTHGQPLAPAPHALTHSALAAAAALAPPANRMAGGNERGVPAFVHSRGRAEGKPGTAERPRVLAQGNGASLMAPTANKSAVPHNALPSSAMCA